MTPPGFSKGASTTGSTSPPETRDKQLDQMFTTGIDWAETDFTSFVESEYDSKLDWSAWGESGRFEKELRHAVFVL